MNAVPLIKEFRDRPLIRNVRQKTMKGALQAITAIGILWMSALMFERTIVPHVMLDAVLPERILSQTTPEERKDITERLKKHQSAGILSWLGAAGITLLSLYALNKEKNKK